MKVKDLLEMDIDIDVTDNVCDELGIAFVGPVELTDEGKREFADVMEFDVFLDDDHASIDVDDYDEAVFEKKIKHAKKLFLALAGFCDGKDYTTWFVE